METPLLLLNEGTKLPIKMGMLKNSCVFRFPNTGKTLPINLVEGNDHRASKCKSLSYKEKIVIFDEEIKKNTWMRIDIEINIKGEIILHIGKNSIASKKIPTFL